MENYQTEMGNRGSCDNSEACKDIFDENETLEESATNSKN